MEKNIVKKRIFRSGIVISDAMDKTVVVKVERRISHPIYQRIIRRSNKFMCHDEQEQCKKGDKVRIEQSRPLSKRKRWRVKEILTKAR